MRSVFSLVVPLALAAITLPAPAQDAKSGKKQESVDPSGTWRLEFEIQGQQIKDRYKLNLGKDGKVTGKLHRRDRTYELRDGKIKGNKLTFTTSGDYQGTEWTAEYVGTIDGDALNGTVTFTAGDREREFPWTPKRSVEMEDVLGTWTIRIPNPNGDDWEPTLVVTQVGGNYKGQYRSTDRTTQEVTNLGVKDNQLTFTAVINRFGTELTLVYTGRPYGGRIKDGTIDVNDGAGNVEFTATLAAVTKERSASE